MFHLIVGLLIGSGLGGGVMYILISQGVVKVK